MKLTINKNKFTVKTVISPKDTSRGMMGKKFDNSFNGMLFIMDDGPHCFWMKNCIIPLDIIFLKDDIITKIHHDCPPCETNNCGNYCGEGDMILELKGGTCERLNIVVGDSVEYFE